jgi:hypothetical protein
MTPKDSPVLCPACRQDVPESVADLNYFAGNCTRPAVDDVGAFLDDLRDLTAYLETLFKLLCHMEDSALDHQFLHHCLYLGWALASETRQRHALADDAWTIVEKRLYAEAHATPPDA